MALHQMKYRNLNISVDFETLHVFLFEHNFSFI